MVQGQGAESILEYSKECIPRDVTFNGSLAIPSHASMELIVPGESEP